MKKPTREDITPSLYGDETLNNNRYAYKLEKYIEYLENKVNDSEVIHSVSVSFSERIQNLIDYRGKKVGECIELNDIEEAARQRIKQEQLVEILYILNER